jgi:ankyrin repeat protein
MTPYGFGATPASPTSYRNRIGSPTSTLSHSRRQSSFWHLMTFFTTTLDQTERIEMNAIPERDAEIILLAPPASPDALVLPEFRLDLGAYFDVFNASELGLRDRVAHLLHADPSLARARNREGKTALTLAALRGHLRTADLLLEYGADIDAPDLLEATVLHRAAQRGRIGIIRYLLQRAANPKAKDLWKKTPLERALAAGHRDAARLLRQAM